MDINATIPLLGVTVLHYIAMHKSVEAAIYLIKHGAPVNGTDKNGETPLFKAVRGVSLEIVKLLRSAGAHVNQL